MSYLVLARKYRPQRFADVVAQSHITETLTKAIENDRIAQAYLFCGVRGTGKTSVARILAKRLNCANPQGAEPCDDCDSCREIIGGRSLDILEIDAASNTSVDDIRELRESIKYTPVGGKHKVYIIDEVHRLSASAFDALLKTLEEPPTHAIFIFATTEVHKVPQTILSRCQRYDFRRISESELMTALSALAEKENLTISEDALIELAKRADGSMRDGISILDQVASWQKDTIDMALLTEALGILPRSAYREIMALIREHETALVVTRINDILSSGVDASEFVRGLQELVRTLLLYKAAPDTMSDFGVTAEEIQGLKVTAEHYSLDDLLRIQNLLVNLEQKIRDGFDPRINLELTLLKLVQMGTSVTLTNILNRLSAGESVVKPANPSSTEGKKKLELTSPEPATPKETKEETKVTVKADAADLNEIWSKLLTELRPKHRNLQTKLTIAQPRDIKGNVISAAFDRSGEFHVRMLQERETKLLLEETVRRISGHSLKFNFFVDRNLTNKKAATGSETLFNQNDSKEHPLITRAMEILEAEVVSREDLPGQ